MRVACLQIKSLMGQPEENLSRVCAQVEKAMAQAPDVIVLPETWNTGFFPRDNLVSLCQHQEQCVKQALGALAKKHHVNIVAGSISNQRGGKLYNTAFVFDRNGHCIASYDKIHLFTPMQEHCYYEKGNRLCTFSLDGVRCGIMICYDLRFPELARSLALSGVDILFTVAQWPEERICQMQLLTAARGVENQAFSLCCNALGGSLIVSPLGEILTKAAADDTQILGECNPNILQDIRRTLPVLQDRAPESYRI